MLDREIRERFKEFQKRTGKYRDLEIDNVRFEKIYLNNENYFEINPKKSQIDDKLLKKNIDVSFVPLASINPILGEIEKHEIRKILDVRNGYTYFQENDVIFTKVTPSMENGNFAIASNLINGIGFGSSEYHIFRCKNVHSKLLWFLFRADFFRNRAKKTMKGTGNLKRVPLYFFSTQYIPIPKPLNQKYTSFKLQEAIVEFLEFWKEEYTDIHRKQVAKKKPIYENIKKIIIQNTFKYDKFLVDKFEEFAKNNNYNLNLINISFSKKNFFIEKQQNLLLPKKLEKNQQLILNNSKENGLPVFTGAKNILCYVDKKNYLNKIFIPNIKNPDISFANNGDGSAGRNFFIHYKPYFVNQERTIISFKNDNDYYSLYIYYFIKDMREKYDMNRNNRPTPKDLPKFNIDIQKPLYINNYTSKEIQQILVEFWETIIGQIDKQLEKYQRILEVADIIDRGFLYRTFNKIDWSKK